MKQNILLSTHGLIQNEEYLTDEFESLTDVLEYALEKGFEEVMGVGGLEGRTILFGREYKVGEALTEIDGLEKVRNEPISGKKLVNSPAFDHGEDDIGRAIGDAQVLAERALMADPEGYIETDLDQAVAIAKNTPEPDAVLVVSDGSDPQGLKRTVGNAVNAGIPVISVDIREAVNWDAIDFGDEEEAEEETEEAQPEAEPTATAERGRPAAEAQAVAGSVD